jgi:hypothetical protein
MSVSIKDKDLGLKSIYKNIESIGKIEVTVGIHANSGANKGVLVAEYATWNHFGTKNIPSRPFISIAFDENQGWINSITSAVNNVISGKDTKFNAVSKLGIKARDDIKKVITKGVPPPNAPSTIKKKKSSKTLIDDGVLISKINYQIKGL